MAGVSRSTPYGGIFKRELVAANFKPSARQFPESKILNFLWEVAAEWGYPPPSRSVGIIELAGNLEIIYGAQ
jgi:hypothetical protein